MNVLLRETCRGCGTTVGVCENKNGQWVVRCGGCDRFQYNLPKREVEKIQARCQCGECKVCQNPEEIDEECKCFIAGWEAAVADMGVRVERIAMGGNRGVQSS